MENLFKKIIRFLLAFYVLMASSMLVWELLFVPSKHLFKNPALYYTNTLLLFLLSITGFYLFYRFFRAPLITPFLQIAWWIPQIITIKRVAFIESREIVSLDSIILDLHAGFQYGYQFGQVYSDSPLGPELPFTMLFYFINFIAIFGLVVSILCKLLISPRKQGKTRNVAIGGAYRICRDL